jgi:trehalose-phosphatase
MLTDVHPTLSGQLRSAILAVLPSARGLDVASDFDGTLVPIVAHPRQTVLADRMRRALASLAALPRARVAVMSGRRLADLEHHVALPNVHLVGLAGIESRGIEGMRRVHSEGRIDPALIREIEDWCGLHHGSWVEDKGLAYSVHYRAVASAQRPEFVSGLNQRLAVHHQGLEITPGLMVHELRPAGSPDKAAALERWLVRRDPQRLLIYLGDDANDLPALERVRELSGVPVAVGPRHVDAPQHLAGPHATMEFLEWLADLWRARVEQESWSTAEDGDGAGVSGESTPGSGSRPDPESARSTPESLHTAPRSRSDPPRSPDPRARRAGTTSR